MGMILCIETSLEKGFVSVVKDGEIVLARENDLQNSHASFIHPAIKDMLNELDLGFRELDAIAVTTGPGSYTGIRIGMAAAKGLVFSYQKPVIGIGTLFLMASAKCLEGGESDMLICPLIDARRMEVFAAVYDSGMNEKLSPTNLVLDENSFKQFLKDQEVIFTGNGANKFREISREKSARFEPLTSLTAAMGKVAENRFQNKKFHTAYSILPQYVKGFYEG